MELELTGPEPPELAGGHTEFGVCHFLSLSGMHPELPHNRKTALWGWAGNAAPGRGTLTARAFVRAEDKCLPWRRVE